MTLFRWDGQNDGNGTRMRPVTVVSYEVLQSGVRVLCGADSAGQGGDQPSRPAFRASTVRRSSSRLARQVSSFFRAVVRSTSAERSSAFSCAVERRTARPKESTVRRGLAAGAGLGGGGGSSAAITRRCPLMMRHVFSPSGVTTMSSKKPSCSTFRRMWPRLSYHDTIKLTKRSSPLSRKKWPKRGSSLCQNNQNN